MADHVAMAGLLDDITGAGLLASALAFQKAKTYVNTVGTTRWAADGVEVERDFVHAADSAQARVGAALLFAGFVGQFVGATRSHWSTTASELAYAIAALLIVAGGIAVPLLRRRREHDIFMAHLDRTLKGTNAGAAAKARHGIVGAYSASFGDRRRPSSRLDGWVAEWERRHGRHPWRPELGPDPDESTPRQ
jgi:hypothetical protein